MTIFIGIDPGVRAVGVAATNSAGLVGALWARSSTRQSLGPNVVEAALEGVRRACGDAGRRDGDWIVGIEFPEVTRGRARGEARTEDLLELSYAIGRIEDAVHRVLRARVVRVLVSTWKKNVTTDVLEARLSRPPPLGLTPEEHATIVWPADSYRHNVVDAVWISRWLADWAHRNTSKNLKDFTVL